MLHRYQKREDGDAKFVAKIYLSHEHGITDYNIDPQAASICLRLNRSGYESYIVGGAIRDILTNRIPKDFDIVTSARPAQIRKLFRQSRVIGRRFRLVHVFSHSKVFEVTTFRNSDSAKANQYGTFNEDVLRRDFTCNTLYFSPQSRRIFDFLGGYEDIKSGILKTVLPPSESFLEDPVRMIRAVKYSKIGKFSIRPQYQNLIRKKASLLNQCSAVRLTDELIKVLSSSVAHDIVKMLYKLGLFSVLVPQIASTIGFNFSKSALSKRLLLLDKKIINREISNKGLRAYLFKLLLADQIMTNKSWRFEENPKKVLAREFEKAFQPLVLPRNESFKLASFYVENLSKITSSD